MEAEKSRDFDALLKVSTRLHQLANMFVHLERITSEEYRSTKLLDEQNIFFTGKIWHTHKSEGIILISWQI